MITIRSWLTAATIAGAGLLLSAGPVVHAQDAPQEGVEVQARGPIHEAYAGPAGAKPRAGMVVQNQPPEAIEELPPDQKPEGDNVQWIPGYWSWDEDRSDYLWVSGLWRVPPPDRQWVPGHWSAIAGGGWQWVPGFWAMPEQKQMEFLPPPPEPVEAGPSVPAPGPDSVFVPGNWVYRQTRYVWRPGFWCGFRPGWVWCPAQYVWTPCGYVFVEGYWDYPLRERGLLFAPVYINRALVVGPGWYYRPRYVVHDDFLCGAMFVRPGCGSYYFGDYFEARYSRLGFTAWVDFRIGRHSYDPLFSYYRWNYRNDRGWEAGVRGMYVGRYSGEMARPPRTLVQQNTIIQNITNNNVTNVNNKTINNIKNVTVLAPINKVDQTVVKLKTVTPERQKEDQRAARELREVSSERRQVEAQMLAKGPAPLKPTDAPRVATVNLPKTPTVKPVTTTGTATNVRVPPPLPIKPEVSAIAKPLTPPVKPETKVETKPSKPDTKPLTHPLPVLTKPEAKVETKPLTPPVKPETKLVTPPTTKPLSQPLPVKPEVKPTPPPALKPEVKPLTTPVTKPLTTPPAPKVTTPPPPPPKVTTPPPPPPKVTTPPPPPPKVTTPPPPPPKPTPPPEKKKEKK